MKFISIVQLLLPHSMSAVVGSICRHDTLTSARQPEQKWRASLGERLETNYRVHNA